MPSSAWARLAQYVIRARADLGWSQEDLAEAAGVKQATISAIESARGTTRPATLARVESALGWAPGSSHAIIAGGDPILVENQAVFSRIDRNRLADYVRARRAAVGYRTAKELADKTGLTPQTISAVENGHSVRLGTLAVVENALGWKPGSAKTILAGGEPELAEAPATDRSLGTPEERGVWNLVGNGITESEAIALIAYLRQLRAVSRDLHRL